MSEDNYFYKCSKNLQLDLGAEFGGGAGGTRSAGAPLWRICTVQVYKTQKYHGQTKPSLT